MAVDLNDYVDVLRREVTPLDADPYDASDDVFVGYLADALYEAMLDGLVDGKWSATEDGIIEDVNGKSFPRKYVSMLVLYAGIRILRLRILNTNTRFSAKAGPAEFFTQQSSQALVEMLRSLDAIKNRLLDSGVETSSYLIDGYTTRIFQGT